MTIVPEHDDAPEFISIVERAVGGVLRRHTPQTLVLIKINNWFGSRWLRFAGKVLGAIGSWSNADNLVVPPFVPNRVISQRRFAAPNYEEIDPGRPVHKPMPSEHALSRKVSNTASGAALVWYSGDSKATGRGAVMAYAPVERSYWPWYASWENSDCWRVIETWDIKRDDLSRLIEQS
jgi:hypothetical protein